MFLFLLLAGCPNKSPPRAAPDTHPVPCLEGIREARDPSSALIACLAETVSDPGCAAAWSGAGGLTPSDLHRIGATCAAGVCPTLGGDPPRLCGPSGAGAGDPAMQIGLVSELMTRALVADGVSPESLTQLAGLWPLVLTWTHPITVTLPPAVPREVPRDVTVSLGANGELFVDGESIAEADLVETLTRLADAYDGVVIHADPSVLYARVIEAMDALREAGFSRFAFSTEPP